MVAAVKELRNSKQLAEILKICLAIGNYLNGSTFRGGAYGFKLDALLKLNETKSNGSGPSSLLHYVAKYMEEKNPKLMDFLAEMPHLADAARGMKAFFSLSLSLSSWLIHYGVDLFSQCLCPCCWLL